MLFAHQGGWDELLITLGPVVVIVAVLLATSWRAAGGDETDDETDVATGHATDDETGHATGDEEPADDRSS